VNDAEFSSYEIIKTLYDDDAGVENRKRFIIDPEGVIQAHEVLTPPVGRQSGEQFIRGCIP
jgi:alkyl hydroperoxide reductase subunit AhpC